MKKILLISNTKSWIELRYGVPNGYVYTIKCKTARKLEKNLRRVRKYPEKYGSVKCVLVTEETLLMD